MEPFDEAMWYPMVLEFGEEYVKKFEMLYFTKTKEMIMGPLSNALVKLTNKARTEPPLSTVLHQEWRIETNA